MVGQPVFFAREDWETSCRPTPMTHGIAPTYDPEDAITFCDAQDPGQVVRRKKRTPLPVLPLLSIFLIQFAEPITATVIYPFVNQFVRDTGIVGGDDRKVGYFAGIVVSK
jgi:hypothetical protein